VFIAGCHAYDLFFLDNGRYKLSNAVVLSSSEHPFVVSGRDDEHCVMTIDNVYIKRLNPTVPAQVQKHGVLDATRFTLENTELQIKGEATFRDCLIHGKALPEGTNGGGAKKEELIKDVAPAEYQKEFANP